MLPLNAIEKVMKKVCEDYMKGEKGGRKMTITIDTLELSEILNYHIQGSGCEGEELEDNILQDIIHKGKDDEKERM